MSRFRVQPDTGPRRHPETPNPLIRVVVAYAPGRLHPATRGWGELHKAEFHELSDPEAQFRLLAELWAAGESFLMLEHDVLPVCAELGLDLDGNLVGICFPEEGAAACVVDGLVDTLLDEARELRG